MRIKKLLVSNQLIADLAKEAVKSALPKDARVLSVREHSDRNAWSLFVESKEYEEVPEGNVVPEIQEPPVVMKSFISKDEIQKLIADEILICHHENTPTIRLTSLAMKLKQ